MDGWNKCLPMIHYATLCNNFIQSLVWPSSNINNIQFVAPHGPGQMAYLGSSLQDPGMFRASSARGRENKYLKFFVRTQIYKTNIKWYCIFIIQPNPSVNNHFMTGFIKIIISKYFLLFLWQVLDVLRTIETEQSISQELSQASYHSSRPPILE